MNAWPVLFASATRNVIELNVQQAVGEWANQVVRIALEEDAVLSGGEMRWLAGRQSSLHLIG